MRCGRIKNLELTVFRLHTAMVACGATKGRLQVFQREHLAVPAAALQNVKVWRFRRTNRGDIQVDGLHCEGTGSFNVAVRSRRKVGSGSLPVVCQLEPNSLSALQSTAVKRRSIHHGGWIA